MDFDFTGKVAIVTGAARGLGRNYALDLARRGAAVVVNDIARTGDEFEAHGVVEEIARDGGVAVASTDSVSSPEGGEAIVSMALESFGSVDVVINNAGFLRCGYFDELSAEEIDEIIDVHLRGAFNVTQPAWRVMKDKGYGRVVLTSSSSGAFSHQGLSNYAAAKMGVLGLCRALAFEGAEHGIGVNAILPYAATTISDTNAVPDIGDHMEKRFGPGDMELYLSRNTTEIVSPMVVYLCSEQCRESGEAYSVCAGRFARVFIGATHGWIASDTSNVSVEDIGENIGAIRDMESFAVPVDLYDEMIITLRDIASTQAS